jgi:putative oxidoreductase
MHRLRTAGIGVLWILQILLAALFVLIGIGKFGDPTWARRFAAWGYPHGFHLVIGVLEACGGLLLVWPRLTSYGAALLGVIMIGASLTHVLHGQTARAGVPLGYLLLVALVGGLRWRSAMRPAVGGRAAQLERI